MQSHADLEGDPNLLADEITTLCGHLDAAEFRLLDLIRLSYSKVERLHAARMAL